MIKAQHHRITVLKREIRRILRLRTVSARLLARVAGQCISVAWAVSPGKLFLRCVYRLLSTRSSWDSLLTLTTPVIQELNWWLSAVTSWIIALPAPGRLMRN